MTATDQSTVVFALVRKLCEAIEELCPDDVAARKLADLRTIASVTLAELARLDAEVLP